ncbi:GNAT family N-acetyltransferase [Floccifex sp.]|uniref:GNAT family N-acetyltransferase n=1 Tax=Floccifex sp. TaxID=2815810 RepID=UPI003F124E8A
MKKQIRQAQKKDLSRIAEISVFVKRIQFRPIFQNDDFSFNELQVLNVIKDYEPVLDKIFVFDDSIVKGFIYIQKQEIVQLYVDAFFQNQKIGSKLIEYAIQYFSVSTLWALEKNINAIRFYNRHDFYPTSIKKLEEGTNEYLIQLKRNQNVLILGDSNTWGFDPRSYFGSKYKKNWIDYLDVDGFSFEGNGINGRLLHDILDYVPTCYDLVLIMLGTNDLLQGRKVDDIVLEMKQYICHFKNAGIICPPVIKIKEFEQKSKELNEKYQEINCFCIPYQEVSLAYDGVHLSEEGHKQFGQYISEYIKKYL